ncbi:conserved unknown protein [Ectocarpus siliculosus]|uniref:Uncharacterized protein n=1 Tax=Ectocarpus siliculosus TaxID=2880 RepID=D7FVT2_ECTSI|nr:conserved unknown protein [Ectocarpus siliculosus]|eukprot:CBJ25452.1 conserved unknown protein [Ectocarpus siliculosus]
MEETRRDGRRANQIRPLAAEQGILNRADGSARFVQGNTSVLAAVYGPAPAKSLRMERSEGATLDVSFKPESGITSSADAESEALLRRSLEEVVLRSRYPRTVVSVIIQVIVDDGAVLSAALNAATMALLNAGVEMTGMALSVTCCITATVSGRSVLLDPCKAEEIDAAATAVVATLSAGGGVLSCHAVGSMSQEEYFACCEAASLGTTAVRSFVRLSAEQKVNREAETVR